jgi:hypothetical protein
MLSFPASRFSAYHVGDDRVISINEAAARAGCSVATLKRCWRRREIKVVKISPRRIGVRLSDLRAFVDSRVA